MNDDDQDGVPETVVIDESEDDDQELNSLISHKKRQSSMLASPVDAMEEDNLPRPVKKIKLVTSSATTSLDFLEQQLEPPPLPSFLNFETQ
jgi:hypothetical protein